MTEGSDKLRFVAKPAVTEFTPLLPIRNVKLTEHDKLAGLMHEAYNVWFGSALPWRPSLEESRAFVKSFFDREVYQPATLVCGPPDKIVSALLVSRPMSESIPRIKQVCTHPLYRSRGLATNLITQCLNVLSGLGVTGLEAVVDAQHGQIVRILRKLGFVESSMP